MTERWKRVEALFAEALGLDPAARPAFLDQACAGDGAARREVEELLDADARCTGDDFLEGSIVAAVDECSGLNLSRLGQEIGPYRLTGELGRGGMGRVYLAERVDQQYRSEVAIKFVQGTLGSPDLVARFRSERQILADLNHPSIARLLDGGTAPDGTPFLVMERIIGQPVDRYCETRALDLPGRLRLFLQVCRAVQFAHQALIVHRDLKPSNILVTDAGQPKLLDFGIAKLLDPDAPDHETTQLRALTPAYASPEQVRGARATVATDVWSLGVLLYRLVAGREPFQLRGLSPGEVERHLAEVDPERPSEAARRPGPPAIPRGGVPAADLDTIILRALGKTPAERYPSIAALAEDLERCLDGRPVLARPATLGYRLGKFTRRYRRELLLAGGALAVTVALTAWYLVRLATARDRAEQASARAEEVADFLTRLFEVSDPAQSGGETITARELLDRGAARIQSALDGQPAVQATMLRVIGDAYGRLGLSEQARPLLEQALTRRRSLASGPDAETATTELTLGITLQDLGDIAGAEPLIRQARATRVKLFGPDHRLVSEAVASLAFLHETKGEFPAAESLWVEVLRVNQRVYPPGAAEITHARVELGGLFRRLGRWQEAEPLLRQGLAEQRARTGERDLDVAATERNLASMLRDRGAFAEAESLYLLALATRRDLLGAAHPEYANTLNSYALLLQQKGDTAAAIAAFQEFITVVRQAYHEPHPSLAAGYSNLAFAELEARRYPEAARHFRLAMQVQDRVLSPGHPNRAHPLVGLGLVRWREGRPTAAEPLFRRALAIRRAALPEGHRDIGEALSDLGACLTDLGRYAEAESVLVEGHRILVAAEGTDARRTRRVEARLALLYDHWDRPDAARLYRPQVIPDSSPGRR